MPIEIAPDARVSKFADIEDSVRGTRIVVGSGTMIDSFVKIKPAGGTGDCVIGAGCWINSGCVIYTGNGFSMADRSGLAANVTIAPVNHAYLERDLPIPEQGFVASRGGIIIEEDVWVGANCVLLDGAVLRRGCVIAAGSVVHREIPAYTVWGGNPLRKITERK